MKFDRVWILLGACLAAVPSTAHASEIRSTRFVSSSPVKLEPRPGAEYYTLISNSFSLPSLPKSQQDYGVGSFSFRGEYVVHETYDAGQNEGLPFAYAKTTNAGVILVNENTGASRYVGSFFDGPAYSIEDGSFSRDTSYSIGDTIPFGIPDDNFIDFVGAGGSFHVAIDIGLQGQAWYDFKTPVPPSQSFIYEALGGSGTVSLEYTLYSAAPEAGTWAMMIGGIGMVGAAARRRRASTKVSFA